MNRRKVKVYYSGRVQGVGFRYAVKFVATGYEVVGLVKNLDDGRVELVAEGEKLELESFLEGVRKSGVGHFIRNEGIAWNDDLEEFKGFKISS